MGRIARLLGFGVAALAAQSTLVTLSPVRDALPDLVVAAILFLATVDIGVVTGAALALVVGYFFDLISGSPVGLHSLVFEFLYLCGRWIQRRLFLAGVLFEVTLAVGAVWAVAVAVLAVRVLAQGQPLAGVGDVALQTAIRSALTAVIAPAVFWAGNRLVAGRRPALAARPLEPPARPVE
ncbi:MAG: rod shape-determining protein MreD [Deltaproteobacteria bacterium]|nr:rod shape-determining protein MreD [Deltaproteobacteria bacterium]